MKKIEKGGFDKTFQIISFEELEKPKAEEKPVVEGTLQFETGTLIREEIEAILNALPVDKLFDRDNALKFFSKAEKRIFVRTKTVLGRKVQLCHPQKNIHVVNRILEAFKKGQKDVAEFWIQIGGRLIHIRYFAVKVKDWFTIEQMSDLQMELLIKCLRHDIYWTKVIMKSYFKGKWYSRFLSLFYRLFMKIVERKAKSVYNIRLKQTPRVEAKT
jgi:hypothetical protein